MTKQVKEGSFTPGKTGTVRCTGIPGPLNEQGEREPHKMLLVFADGSVQTEDGQIYVPAQRSKDGTEVRYLKAAEGEG